MAKFGSTKHPLDIACCDGLDHLPHMGVAEHNVKATSRLSAGSLANVTSLQNLSPGTEDVVTETRNEAIVSEPENDLNDATPELHFERETSIPDFERETVYDVDSFEQKSSPTEKLLAPPPDFQKSLKSLSPNLKKSFKDILNGDIVGIWPIKRHFLLK